MEHNHNDGHNPKMPIAIQLKNESDRSSHQAVVKLLNIFLADESVLTIKTRGAHWNVHGADFYDRHTLFDNQYQQLNDISDEILKRARMLGGQPIGSFEEFLKNTRLNEQPGDIPNMMDLLADHEAVIGFLREDAKKCSDAYEDEVTHDFLVDIQSLHEKMAWMLRSYGKTGLTGGESQESII